MRESSTTCWCKAGQELSHLLQASTRIDRRQQVCGAPQWVLKATQRCQWGAVLPEVARAACTCRVTRTARLACIESMLARTVGTATSTSTCRSLRSRDADTATSTRADRGARSGAGGGVDAVPHATERPRRCRERRRRASALRCARSPAPSVVSSAKRSTTSVSHPVAASRLTKRSVTFDTTTCTRCARTLTRKVSDETAA